jgi:hypothetical protein
LNDGVSPLIERAGDFHEKIRRAKMGFFSRKRIDETERPQAEETPKETDGYELIAVLTAAVAASLKTSAYNLKIRSYRRIPQDTPVWNATARVENIY